MQACSRADTAGVVLYTICIIQICITIAVVIQAITDFFRIGVDCCVIVIAGIWPLLREWSFLSQRSKWRAFLNVAADAFCTMTFVWASLWLNPSNQAFFQLFLHSPLAVMLTWPLGVPVIIARLFAVPVPATMPWLAVRLGLLLAMVVLCVAVAWARVRNSRRRAGPILGH